MQISKYMLALVLGNMMIIPYTALATDLSARRPDTDLARFVEAVIEANPKVQAARAALDASQALQSAASRPLYNPELFIDLENAETNTRAIGISQTIDWGDKRSARTSVAEQDRLVVEAQYDTIRRTVTVDLLNGFAQYQNGVASEALASNRTALMDGFTVLAERRFEAGDLAQIELDLARLAFNDARIKQATAAAKLAAAKQSIRSLAPNTAASRWPQLPDEIPHLPKNNPDPQKLIMTLPEVLAARRRVDAADAVVQLRQRQRRADPTISLAGGREANDTLIGLNLSIPLFVRNRFNNEVTAAIAERSQAERIQDDVLLGAHARLVGAAERYELSSRAWLDWKQTGQLSLTRQGEQLRKLWEAGEISTTDYLVQLRQILDIQESILELKQVLWAAWFEWLAASGQVDTWLGLGAIR